MVGVYQPFDPPPLQAEEDEEVHVAQELGDLLQSKLELDGILAYVQEGRCPKTGLSVAECHGCATSQPGHSFREIGRRLREITQQLYGIMDSIVRRRVHLR